MALGSDQIDLTRLNRGRGASGGGGGARARRTHNFSLRLPGGG